jgi:hypothetical protein
MYDWHIRSIASHVHWLPAWLFEQCMLIYSHLVIVKALARLLTDPPSINHPNQQPGRSILAITSLIMKYPLDAQTRIQSNQIGKRKRTHWMTHTKSEGGIDIFGCCDTLPRQYVLGKTGRTFSRTRMASLSIGMRIALAMNPGESLD